MSVTDYIGKLVLTVAMTMLPGSAFASVILNDPPLLIEEVLVSDALNESEVGNPPSSTFFKVTITRDQIDPLVDPSFRVQWSVPAGTQGDDGTLPIDLTAEALFTIANYDQDELVVSINIFNSTQFIDSNGDPVLFQGDTPKAGITSFGFGVDPNLDRALTSPGKFFVDSSEGSGGAQSFPGGFKGIDVCIFTDGCSGGSQGSSLPAGEIDFLDITLTGNVADGTDPLPGQVTLLFFPIKWQTDWGSFEPNGVVIVPAPAGLALMLPGLFLLYRRQRRL